MARPRGDTRIMVALFVIASLAVGFLAGVEAVDLGTEDLEPGIVVECRDSVIVRIAVLNGPARDRLRPDVRDAIRTLPAACRRPKVMEQMNPVTLRTLARSPLPAPEDA